MYNPILLLIDDDFATRTLINDILEDAPVTILQAKCGREAMQMFRQLTGETTLVLIDICLPDCTGWELLKELRTINPAVQVIAMSAMSPEEFGKKCKEAAVSTFFSKPLNIGRVRDEIMINLKI